MSESPSVLKNIILIDFLIFTNFYVSVGQHQMSSITLIKKFHLWTCDINFNCFIAINPEVHDDAKLWLSFVLRRSMWPNFIHYLLLQNNVYMTLDCTHYVLCSSSVFACTNGLKVQNLRLCSKWTVVWDDSKLSCHRFLRDPSFRTLSWILREKQYVWNDTKLQLHFSIMRSHRSKWLYTVLSPLISDRQSDTTQNYHLTTTKSRTWLSATTISYAFPAPKRYMTLSKML